MFAPRPTSTTQRSFNAHGQNAVPVPTVCNIDSLLPPFSDGCSHPAVFTAICAVDHKPHCDRVTASGPVCGRQVPGFYICITDAAANERTSMLPAARARKNWPIDRIADARLEVSSRAEA